MALIQTNALRRQQVLVDSLKAAAPYATAITAVPTIPGPTQPTDPANPGSGVYPYSDYTVGKYRIWHYKFITVYPTIVTYLIPAGAVPSGGFPVICISPGKFLDNPQIYNRLLLHICLKGYVVMFVDPDTGPLDCEHSRMAGEFLQAVSQTIKNKLAGVTSNPPKIAWWGHSMGAKVQALASQMTGNKYYLTPAAVIANNFSNDKGQFCSDDALKNTSATPASVKYTLIQGDRDTISKEDPCLLYQALVNQNFRQLITAVSYPEDELIADHFAPLTDEGIPVSGKVDALDWWLYWKIAVGAFDFHFKNGPDTWAYGAERTDGGTDASGKLLTHRVEQKPAN